MAINYNADVLPLYDTKLETNPEYVQELATISSRAFPDSDTTVVGAVGDSFLLNTVAVVVGGSATLDDWEAAAVATAPVTGGDLTVAVIQQNDGQYVLAFAAVDDGTPVDIVIAVGGGGPNGLPALGLPAGTVKSGGDLDVGRADQPSEQRILTTLGVLISHLRLMDSRVEARNLHFVLSRIATGVGSGGFIYDDLTAEVTGNRKNPVFVSGDRIHIELQNEGEGKEDTAPVAVDVTTAGVTLAVLVGEINAASPSAAGLTASDAGGYLKLESADGLTISLVTGAVNDIATKTAGLEFGDNRSKRNEVAEKVKEEALDYFDTNRRGLNM